MSRLIDHTCKFTPLHIEEKTIFGKEQKSPGAVSTMTCWDVEVVVSACPCGKIKREHVE
jgi:hypothetical protein